MKSPMNQVKPTVDSIIRRKDYTKERSSEMEDRPRRYFTQTITRKNEYT
jgi:hypothetical protein